MARRVAFLAALALAAAGPAGASAASSPGAVERSGISESLLGRWERSLPRLSGADRTSAYFRASTLLALERRTEAFALLRDLSSTAGSFSGPALELATGRLFEEGDYAGVVAWSDRATAGKAQDPDSLRYAVGQSRYLLGDLEGARRELEAVAGGPRRAYALHTLALIHFQEGRLREAVDLLGAGVEAAGRHPDPVLGGELADRLRVTRGQVLYQAGVGLPELAAAGRKSLFVLARDQFEKVRPGALRYPEALRGAGWCAAELGDSARALGAFEAAAAADPARRHEDLWAQGRVYQRLGFYDEAARFYGLAREAALAEGAALEAGTSPDLEAPQARGWAALGRRVAGAANRTAELVELGGEAGAALDARDGRLAWSAQRVAWARGRAQARIGELEEMAVRLKDHMDRIPAAALFPRAARARWEGVSARQEELGLQIARVEATFGTLGGSEIWEESAPELRSRGRVLWARLEAAGERLAAAQLAFLEALKQRVSEREKELEQAIAELRAATQGLGDPATALESRLAEARARQADRRARFEALQARLDTASRRLLELAEAAAAGEAAARREGAGQAARRLALRADAIALDETQALHLWRQGGTGSGGGVRP